MNNKEIAMYEDWEPEKWVREQEIREIRHEVESLGVWLLAFLTVFLGAAWFVLMLVVWG
jgi:hypothetical protein